LLFPGRRSAPITSALPFPPAKDIFKTVVWASRRLSRERPARKLSTASLGSKTTHIHSPEPRTLPVDRSAPRLVQTPKEAVHKTYGPVTPMGLRRDRNGSNWSTNLSGNGGKTQRDNTKHQLSGPQNPSACHTCTPSAAIQCHKLLRSSWVHGEEEKSAQSEPGSCASEAVFVLPQKWLKK
jgi:hypothetical protein